MIINMTSASNMTYIPHIKITEHNLILDHAITQPVPDYEVAARK
jgi:hypothetical protein